MRFKIACDWVRYVPVLNERPLLPGRRQLSEATAKHNHRTEQLGQILPQGIGALAEQVDALLLHHCDGFFCQTTSTIKTCAEHGEPGGRTGLQQAMGHL